MFNVVFFRKSGLIEVVVTAESQKDKNKPLRWRTTEVEKYLKANNITFGKCIKGNVLTNTNPSKKMARWLFVDPNTAKHSLDKPENDPVSSTKKKSTSKKKRKVETPVKKDVGENGGRSQTHKS